MQAREAASCVGKETFDSFVQAEAVVRRLTKCGRAVEPYRCDWCHHWHIGGLAVPRAEKPRSRRGHRHKGSQKGWRARKRAVRAW